MSAWEVKKFITRSKDCPTVTNEFRSTALASETLAPAYSKSSVVRFAISLSRASLLPEMYCAIGPESHWVCEYEPSNLPPPLICLSPQSVARPFSSTPTPIMMIRAFLKLTLLCAPSPPAS